MELYNEDCLIGLNKLKNKSIDCCFIDLPYGITRNKWDSKINLELFWNEINRVIKDTCVCICTAQQPFTTELINSNSQNFKYTMVWVKNIPTGIALSEVRPMRYHEDIVIFYKKRPKYNSQGEKLNKEVYLKLPKSGTKRDSNSNVVGGSKGGQLKLYTHKRKGSVLYFNRSKSYGNTTSKPIELVKYLIETFTEPNDIILDPTFGSGTTAIACFELNRNFIGFEKCKEQYKIALNRIKKETF